MKRATAKKAVARPTQRKARTKGGSEGKTAARRRVPSAPASLTGEQEICQHCAKDLEHEPRALFVEQEVGRLFCSEECITGYFATEIQHLEREYFQRLSDTDLSAKERVALAHLRWTTLERPDEVWRERTLSGDSRFTLISQFPGEDGGVVWSICICLFLNDEPSFLYLAFPTKSEAMVEYYRTGERYVRDLTRAAQARAEAEANASEFAPTEDPEKSGETNATDRLGAPWTADETYRAQLVYERSDDDIAPEEFGEYQECLEPTLDEPDEIWSYFAEGPGQPKGAKIYHFIKRFPTEDEDGAEHSTWFIIMAKESDDAEQIEILDAFPTRDPGLVDRHRHGNQETGTPGQAGAASVRLVH